MKKLNHVILTPMFLTNLAIDNILLKLKRDTESFEWINYYDDYGHAGLKLNFVKEKKISLKNRKSR